MQRQTPAHSGGDGCLRFEVFEEDVEGDNFGGIVAGSWDAECESQAGCFELCDDLFVGEACKIGHNWQDGPSFCGGLGRVGSRFASSQRSRKGNDTEGRDGERRDSQFHNQHYKTISADGVAPKGLRDS